MGSPCTTTESLAARPLGCALARRGGAIGELTPVVNNYHDIETIGG